MKFKNFPTFLLLIFILSVKYRNTLGEIPPVPYSYNPTPEYGYSLNRTQNSFSVPFLKHPSTSMKPPTHSQNRLSTRNHETSTYPTFPPPDEDSQSTEMEIHYTPAPSLDEDSNEDHNSEGGEEFYDEHYKPRKKLRNHYKRRHHGRKRRMRAPSTSLLEFLMSPFKPFSKKLRLPSIFPTRNRNRPHKGRRYRDSESLEIFEPEHELELEFDLDVDSDSSAGNNRRKTRGQGWGWRQGRKRRGRKRRGKPRRGDGWQRRPKSRPHYDYDEDDDDFGDDYGDSAFLKVLFSDDKEHFGPGLVNRQYNQGLHKLEQHQGVMSNFEHFNTESVNRPAEFHASTLRPSHGVSIPHKEESDSDDDEFPRSIYDKLPPPHEERPYMSPPKSTPPMKFMQPPSPPLRPPWYQPYQYSPHTNINDVYPSNEEYGSSFAATTTSFQDYPITPSYANVPSAELDEILFMSPPKPYPETYSSQPSSSPPSIIGYSSNRVPKIVPFETMNEPYNSSPLRLPIGPNRASGPHPFSKIKNYYKHMFSRLKRRSRPRIQLNTINYTLPASTMTTTSQPQIIYGKWNPLLDKLSDDAYNTQPF